MLKRLFILFFFSAFWSCFSDSAEDICPMNNELLYTHFWEWQHNEPYFQDVTKFINPWQAMRRVVWYGDTTEWVANIYFKDQCAEFIIEPKLHSRYEILSITEREMKMQYWFCPELDHCVADDVLVFRSI